MRRGVASSVTAGIALSLLLAGWILAHASTGETQRSPDLADGPPGDDASLAPAPLLDQRATVTDPEGDAVPSGGAGDDAPLPGACDPGRPGCAPAPPPAPDAEPDPPATAMPPPEPLDIVEAGYERREDGVLGFFLRLADVDMAWPSLRAETGQGWTLHYGLCWAPHAGQACDRWVSVDVWHHAGAVATAASYRLASPTCGPRAICEWPAEAAFEPGTPGAVRFSIPAAYATADGSWPQIAGLTGATSWTGTALEGITGPITLDASPLGLSLGTGAPGSRRVADATAPHPTVLRFGGEPIAGGAQVRVEGRMGTSPGPGRAGDHPALDLRGLLATAGDGRLRVELMVASTRDWPADTIEHRVDVDAGDAAWRLVHRRTKDHVQASLLPCDPQCDPHRAASLAVTYGGDGQSIVFDVPLAGLGLRPGATTHRLAADAFLVRAAAHDQDADVRERFDALPVAAPLLVA